MNENIGKLYIVATPIGNPKDITIRGKETLESVNTIICEEIRQASTLLKKLDIPRKELITLNEHNEKEQIQEILEMMLVEGKSFALISDCGTPVFADPGASLIKTLAEFQIEIIPIPGPSSLMTALSILDFKIDSFIFGGFLSRNSRQRIVELEKLKSYRMPIIIMDTPYRMTATIEDTIKVFGAKQKVTLACDLTLKSETIFRGEVALIHKKIENRKAEFILIIHSDSINKSHNKKRHQKSKKR